MQKSVFFLLAALLTAASASAQTTRATPAAEQQAATQAQRLAQELGLSADQHARLRQVLLLTRQHMDADRATHQDDPTALRTAMAANRAKSEELIRGALTPAQYARYQQLKAARISQLHTTMHTD